MEAPVLHSCVRCDKVCICAVCHAILRLDRKHVVAPPGASSPPQSTSPNIRVLGHIRKYILDSSFAIGVDGTCKLANQSSFLVVTEPGCRRLETFATNSLGDTGRGGTGAVLVDAVSSQSVLRHGEHTESRYWCIW